MSCFRPDSNVRYEPQSAPLCSSGAPLTTPRSDERGVAVRVRSVAGAAGPDEGVAFAILGLDQAGVDRGGEARIVQLDGEVVAALAGGLFPGGSEFGVMRCTA